MFSDVHVKMKGGDGDTHYLFSIGYTSENEVLKEAKDQRINMRFNLDFKISPKIKITNLFAYNYGNNRFWGMKVPIGFTILCLYRQPKLRLCQRIIIRKQE